MSLSPESLERVYTAANELGEMLGLILLSFTGLIAWSFLLVRLCLLIKGKLRVFHLGTKGLA